MKMFRRNRDPKPESTKIEFNEKAATILAASCQGSHQALEPTLLDELEDNRRSLNRRLEELEAHYSNEKHMLNRAIGKCEEDIAFLKMIYERHPASDKALRSIMHRLTAAAHPECGDPAPPPPPPDRPLRIGG
jgi:hypothetical protein